MIRPTYHYYPHGEAVPESPEANVLVYSAHHRTKGFARLSNGVEFRDHHVCWMADNGAQNAGNVTTSKRDGSLGALAVIGLRTGQAMIYHFDDSLERCESVVIVNPG